MIKQKLFIYGFIHMMVMLSMTIWASLQQSIIHTAPLFDHAWFIATLTDTYLLLFLIYMWTAYVTKSWTLNALWFVLYMGLGSIAIGLFLMVRAYHLPPHATLKNVLLGDNND